MDQNTLEVTERSEVFEFSSLRDMVNQALQQNFGEVQLSNGVSSGFKDLDKVIQGFRKGSLSTIAVKPGMGKTALMLSIANNVAIKNNYSVAIFSSERSSKKITHRLIESETGMSLKKLLKGNLKPSEKDHMYSLVSHIAKANVYLDDTPGLTADDISQKLKMLRTNTSVDLVIIDYLELLAADDKNTDERPEQLSRIVSTIRNIAQELNLPVLLFSQIPGHYPGNVLKRPSIQDLPVYLSELSDVVMYLHRSDVNYQNGKGNEPQNYVELIVGKNHAANEQTIVHLRFIESLAKFTDAS